MTDNIINFNDLKDKLKNKNISDEKTYKYQLQELATNIFSILEDGGYDITDEKLIDDISTVITLLMATMNRQIGVEDPYIDILDEFSNIEDEELEIEIDAEEALSNLEFDNDD